MSDYNHKNRQPFQTRLALIVAAIVATIPGFVFAAGECGTAPVAPAIVDGAVASMEELVANSQSVKGYIEVADEYLTCQEAYFKGEDYTSLNPDEQQTARDAYSQLLDSRNAIGESFNEQVRVYNEAHPNP